MTDRTDVPAAQPSRPRRRPLLTPEEKAARKQAREEALLERMQREAKEWAAENPLRPEDVPWLTRLIRGPAILPAKRADLPLRDVDPGS